MFGIIPQPLWSKTNPPDERNRIDLACRCLLIEHDDRNVLVDVGIGTKWDERGRDIYNIHDQDPGLAGALGQLGLSRESIDDVIVTHLHFDHAGGLSRYADGSDGRIVPTFPEATHWVQRRNWSWAHEPSPRDEGSYREQDFACLERSDAPELRLVDGIDEILPGIEVLPLHGHTFGMQAVKIETDEHVFVYLADLIPTTSHMADAYVMGYDLQPLETVEEKREMLHRASRNDWILFFEHDPYQAFARPDMEGDSPRAIPVDPDELSEVRPA